MLQSIERLSSRLRSGEYSTDILSVDQDEVVFSRMAKEEGIRYLGAGVHRAAFQVGEVVYKIPRGSYGEQANEREVDIFTFASDEFRRNLVPILDFKPKCYVAMPLVEPFSTSWEEPTPADLRRLGVQGRNWDEAIQKLEESFQAEANRLEFEWFFVDLHWQNVTKDFRILDYAGG